MQDRGLAAYIAELIGTFLLVFFITTIIVLFEATGNQAQFGSDFAVIGLVYGFALFGLVTIFGSVSGGHFNPAVTTAVAALRRIDPIDAVVYILAQLSGGVLGALATKFLLKDEGRATHYGAARLTELLGSPAQGAFVEAIGTFILVLVICAAVLSVNAKDWAPLAIGLTFGAAALVAGPLTGAGLNPARWFGPALVDGDFGGFAGIWPFVIGPLVGGLLAAAVFRFVVEPGKLSGTSASPDKAAPAVKTGTGAKPATGSGSGTGAKPATGTGTTGKPATTPPKTP